MDCLNLLPHVQHEEAQKIHRRFTRIFEKNTEPNEEAKNRFLLFAYLVTVYERDKNDLDLIQQLVTEFKDAISPKVYFDIHKLEIKNEYIKNLYELFRNVFYDVNQPTQKRIDASVYMMYITDISKAYEKNDYISEDSMMDLFFLFDEGNHPTFPEELLAIRNQLLS